MNPNTKRTNKIIQATQDYVNDEIRTNEFISQILEIERNYYADLALRKIEEEQIQKQVVQ